MNQVAIKYMRIINICLINFTLFVIISISYSIKAYCSDLNDSDEVIQKVTNQDEIISKRIVSRILHSHYLDIDVNDELSKRILNRYISELDEYHRFFLKAEVQMFKNENMNFANKLRDGKLQSALSIAKQVRVEKLKFYNYVLDRIKKPINVERGDFILYDSSDAKWPEDDNARTALWDKVVTDELIRLMVSGHEQKEAIEIIHARYLRLKSYLFRKNDIFSIIINSFLKSIEPHARYLSADESIIFETSMSLHLSGIGVSLRQAEDYSTEVAGTTPGGPADLSGKILPGDRILWVKPVGRAGIDVSDLLIDEISRLIRGEPGSVLTLGLKSKSGNLKKVTLMREIIEQEELHASVLKENVSGKQVAVVTVPSFYEGVADDVDKSLNEIVNDVDVIVMNLMDNGGGSLSEAVLLSNLFTGAGPVVQVRSRTMATPRILGSNFTENYKLPVVVLVNRASASASEIFAAALQDYGVAVVAGERTFGKGTVQERYSLSRIYDMKRYPDWSPPGSLIYTIQKFYRVSGDSTQIRGVIPDIQLPFGGKRMGERFENGALLWDRVDPAVYNSKKELKKFIPVLRQKSEERLSYSKHLRCLKILTKSISTEEGTIALPLSLIRRREISALDRRNDLRCLTQDEITNKGDLVIQGAVVRYALEEAINVAADLSEQINPTS